MSTPNLKEYIDKKRTAGLKDDEIKSKLLAVGWSEKTVIEALNEGEDIPLPPQKTQTDIDIKTNFWDIFEHVILFISLYVFTFALGQLIHNFINNYLPSTTYNDYYSYRGGYNRDVWDNELVTGYAAALIVSFPVFYFLFRRITARTLKNPDLRRVKVRKLLIYLTLVGTFIILTYKAIATVYTLLNGNITINFLLHFLVTVGISGAIFAYYFNEVKEDRNALKNYEKN